MTELPSEYAVTRLDLEWLHIYYLALAPAYSLSFVATEAYFLIYCMSLSLCLF